MTRSVRLDTLVVYLFLSLNCHLCISHSAAKQRERTCKLGRRRIQSLQRALAPYLLLFLKAASRAACKAPDSDPTYVGTAPIDQFFPVHLLEMLNTFDNDPVLIYPSHRTQLPWLASFEPSRRFFGFGSQFGLGRPSMIPGSTGLRVYGSAIDAAMERCAVSPQTTRSVQLQ